MAAKHSSHDFSLLTGAHLSLRLSLLDRSRCEEGDLVEATAIVPKRGIIAGGRGHDRGALADLEQALGGSTFFIFSPAAAGAFSEEQRMATRMVAAICRACRL